MSYSLKVVASGQENVALFTSDTGDSLLIDTNGNSNFYKDVSCNSNVLGGGNINGGNINGKINVNYRSLNLFSSGGFGITDDVVTKTLTAIGKFTGGVLAPNGKIYCIPWNATTLQVITPSVST